MFKAKKVLIIVFVFLFTFLSSVVAGAADVRMSLEFEKISDAKGHQEVKFVGTLKFDKGTIEKLTIEKKTKFTIVGIFILAENGRSYYNTIRDRTDIDLTKDGGIAPGNHSVRFFLLYEPGMDVNADVLIDGVTVADLVWKDTQSTKSTTKATKTTKKQTIIL